MRFKCMFHLEVVCVSSGYCKSRSSVAYVAMATHVLPPFQIISRLNFFGSSILLCIWIYIHSKMDVPKKVKATYNLERSEYVASVCFKCFSCFRRMLQVFYLDIAVAIHICCKHMF
jgi:hypothetical protein